MATPGLEQQVDAWLTTHQHSRECPACGSDQRRIDFNPPRAASWRSAGSGGSRFQAGPQPPPERIEITCMGCAGVRVFDAKVMGV